MGWGRAGWYTYRWVDRLLFPANGPSADQLRSQHQRLEIGDKVPDGPPEVDCWFTVEQLELAAQRANAWADPAHPAQPNAP
jgi:hypothetical protein